VQVDLNKAKFYKEFIDLMTRPAPAPTAASLERFGDN
jgi:hypothetical protein